MADQGAANYPEADVTTGKTWAILSYFCCLWIIPVIKKDNAFSLYHAKQALGLTLLSIAFNIVTTVLANISPTVGSILSLLGLAFLVLLILGVIKAIGGKYEPIPLVGPMFENMFKGMQKK